MDTNNLQQRTVRGAAALGAAALLIAGATWHGLAAAANGPEFNPGRYQPGPADAGRFTRLDCGWTGFVRRHREDRRARGRDRSGRRQGTRRADAIQR